MLDQIGNAATNFWKTLPDVLTRIAAALGILIVGIILLAYLLAKRILPRTTALFTGNRTGLKTA